MPGYPSGSPFILDGLMASSPGLPVGEQLNGMSAWQNTNTASFQRLPEQTPAWGSCFTALAAWTATVGYFTNHDVIPQKEIGTQPSRAVALAAFPASSITADVSQ